MTINMFIWEKNGNIDYSKELAGSGVRKTGWLYHWVETQNWNHGQGPWGITPPSYSNGLVGTWYSM